MKRKICVTVALVFCFAILMSASVCAATYRLSETDLSVRVDDSLWYVFTRDNIKNNPELDEFEMSYDEMYNILQSNNAYMDAVLLYEDGEFTELFIRKKQIEGGVVNLSSYEDSDILAIAKELAATQGAATYDLYKNQYKFARLEYVDSALGYYICEFVTIVNGDAYSFTFQASSQFSDWEYEEIDSIIDSIRFEVDASLAEPETSSFWDTVLEKGIVGAVLGGIGGLVGVLINRKKKKTKENETPSDNENTETEIEKAE